MVTTGGTPNVNPTLSPYPKYHRLLVVSMYPPNRMATAEKPPRSPQGAIGGFLDTWVV